MFGGTREGELQRAAELLVEIAEEQGAHYMVAFIVDVGYSQDDLQRVVEIMQERHLGFNGGYYTTIRAEKVNGKWVNY